MSETKPYEVIRDTREQLGWTFAKHSPCLGTVSGTLKTGDYTLKGLEETFVIERKRNTAEVAANVAQDRFWRELERLESFALPFIVCEFSLADVLSFPENSGIPEFKWK